MGISLAGVFRIEGIVEWEGACLWNALYPYQPELSALLLDCFRMSFQSGEVFCSSHAIRGFPCQDATSQTPEFVLRVYQRI